MQFIVGQSSELPAHVKERLFTYRHKVFVDKLKWELDVSHGVEVDQFDHDKTFYVIANSEDQEVVGCARLLPTTMPYLLEEVFHPLLNGSNPPKSSEIWELSRFTSVNLMLEGDEKSSSYPQRQFPENITKELLLKALECAKANGAKKIVTVSPIGVERLLRSAGVEASRAGPPMVIDGYPLVVCVIDLTRT